MRDASGFEWDADKAAGNHVKHGVSFEYAIGVFTDAAAVDVDASRANEPEVRRKAIGTIEGRVFTVVYTMRSGVIRIISARRANTQESRAYAYGPTHTRSE